MERSCRSFILSGVDSRIPVDVAPIREEGASLSWFERVFGDGPIVVSMLVLVCTALGFGAAMLCCDEESDEWVDEYEDENEGKQ